MSNTVDFFRQIADSLESAEQRPHGPQVGNDEKAIAGDACVRLCAGDRDKARTLWKLIASDLDGYLPRAAAVALIRASNTGNLVPDVEAPEPS